MVAVMLIDKTASFKAAHDTPRMQDPAVLRERARSSSYATSRAAIMPASRRRGGSPSPTAPVLTERVDAVSGTPRNPMSRAEVIDKARDLMAPVVGASPAARLIETVFRSKRSRTWARCDAAAEGVGEKAGRLLSLRPPRMSRTGRGHGGIGQRTLFLRRRFGSPASFLPPARLLPAPRTSRRRSRGLLVQHHHVGHAEDPHVVELQVIGLRGAVLGGVPRVDGIHGVLADHVVPA